MKKTKRALALLDIFQSIYCDASKCRSCPCEDGGKCAVRKLKGHIKNVHNMVDRKRNWR